jgi:hypothetical protein
MHLCLMNTLCGVQTKLSMRGASQSAITFEIKLSNEWIKLISLNSFGVLDTYFLGNNVSRAPLSLGRGSVTWL